MIVSERRKTRVRKRKGQRDEEPERRRAREWKSGHRVRGRTRESEGGGENE